MRLVRATIPLASFPIPAAFNKTLAPHHPVLNFDSAENRN
jgi:hypothetical protein